MCEQFGAFSISGLSSLISLYDTQWWRQTEKHFQGIKQGCVLQSHRAKEQIRKGITSLHVTGWAWMKMLIAFQKSSQNREATQNGGVFSLAKKRDFTIHWPTHNFKEQAFVHSRSFLRFLCISKIATVLHSFVSPTFWHAGLLFQQSPSYSGPLLFSRLYSITPKQGHAQHTHPRYSRCGRASLSGLCSIGRTKGQMAELRWMQIPEQVWQTDPY